MLCDFFDCAPVLGVLGYKNRIPRCIARALIPTSNVADQLNLCRQCQPFIFRFRNGALKWNRGRRLKTSLYCGVRRWQIMLTEENVLEIYRAKIALQSQLLETHHTEGSSVMKNLLRGKSSQFSGRYGVSARTIRDIWNRRTWSYATKILWREDTTFFHKTADDSYSHAPYAIQVLNFSTMRRSIEDVSNY